MDDPVGTTPVRATPQPAVLSLGRVLRSGLESGIESFIKACLVLLFGSVAIGLVGGMWKQMTPSPPPGFSAKSEVEPTAPSAWGAEFREHRFLIVFSLIFALTLWSRLARLRRKGEPSKRSSRLERIGMRLSDGWLALIVGNAFGAMLSAIVVIWAQRFTAVYWVLDLLAAEARDLAQSLFGTGGPNGLGAWFSWYGHNRLKFAFWCFYLAAICDDLGLPNLKTFGRWLARKARPRLHHRPTAFHP
ncbi:MAG TPA: hypothetical protein VJA21_34300 [Verrucomicrobiae bacterium]